VLRPYPAAHCRPSPGLLHVPFQSTWHFPPAAKLAESQHGWSSGDQVAPACCVKWLYVIATRGFSGDNRVRILDKRERIRDTVFIQIPKDPLLSAQEKVPAGAAITNVNSTPNDWATLLGFFNRLFGIGFAQIGGTTSVP
jgi:hypothetical protein